MNTNASGVTNASGRAAWMACRSPRSPDLDQVDLEVRAQGLPVVLIDWLVEPDVDQVGVANDRLMTMPSSNTSAGWTSTRRIVAGDRPADPEERPTGYRAAFSAVGQPLDEELVWLGAWMPDDAQTQVSQNLDPVKPTALVASSMERPGALQAIGIAVAIRPTSPSPASAR